MIYLKAQVIKDRKRERRRKRERVLPSIGSFSKMAVPDQSQESESALGSFMNVKWPNYLVHLPLLTQVH